MITYIRAGVAQWMATLWEKGALHGWELVNMMCDAAHGRYFVGPADADDFLRMAESAGWIVRDESGPSPNLSQRAFAGLSHSKKGYKDSARFYGSHWNWFPNRSNPDAQKVAESYQAGIQQKNPRLPRVCDIGMVDTGGGVGRVTPETTVTGPQVETGDRQDDMATYTKEQLEGMKPAERLNILKSLKINPAGLGTADQIRAILKQSGTGKTPADPAGTGKTGRPATGAKSAASAKPAPAAPKKVATPPPPAEEPAAEESADEVDVAAILERLDECERRLTALEEGRTAAQDAANEEPVAEETKGEEEEVQEFGPEDVDGLTLETARKLCRDTEPPIKFGPKDNLDTLKSKIRVAMGIEETPAEEGEETPAEESAEEPAAEEEESAEEETPEEESAEEQPNLMEGNKPLDPKMIKPSIKCAFYSPAHTEDNMVYLGEVTKVDTKAKIASVYFDKGTPEEPDVYEAEDAPFSSLYPLSLAPKPPAAKPAAKKVVKK